MGLTQRDDAAQIQADADEMEMTWDTEPRGQVEAPSLGWLIENRGRHLHEYRYGKYQDVEVYVFIDYVQVVYGPTNSTYWFKNKGLAFQFARQRAAHVRAALRAFGE